MGEDLLIFNQIIMSFSEIKKRMKKIAPWNDPDVRWVCEDHPTKDQEHRLFPFFWLRCGGAGMPEPTEENIKKGYII